MQSDVPELLAALERITGIADGMAEVRPADRRARRRRRQPRDRAGPARPARLGSTRTGPVARAAPPAPGTTPAH
ncbi:MAG: hypothetical protein R2712_02165 [Vicinamibacterales bacterium]